MAYGQNAPSCDSLRGGSVSIHLEVAHIFYNVPFPIPHKAHFWFSYVHVISFMQFLYTILLLIIFKSKQI